MRRLVNGMMGIKLRDIFASISEGQSKRNGGGA
jgi:hypothetical protein